MKHKIINGWTKKSIMEQVKKHNDGTKAIQHPRGCLYLTDTGNRCAIGCFIPDGHRGLKEAASALLLLNFNPDLADKMPFSHLSEDETPSLLVFQAAHDNCDGNVHEAIQKFLDEECEE